MCASPWKSGPSGPRKTRNQGASHPVVVLPGRLRFRYRLFRSVWIHQYLAGFARFQAGHGFGKIFHRDAVGDYGVKIEASALEQGGHLVPGLVHAAAVDALNGEAFEDDVFGEVERDGFRGEAEERDASAAADDVEGGADGVG